MLIECLPHLLLFRALTTRWCFQENEKSSFWENQLLGLIWEWVNTLVVRQYSTLFAVTSSCHLRHRRPIHVVMREDEQDLLWYGVMVARCVLYQKKKSYTNETLMLSVWVGFDQSLDQKRWSAGFCSTAYIRELKQKLSLTLSRLVVLVTY